MQKSGFKINLVLYDIESNICAPVLLNLIKSLRRGD